MTNIFVAAAFACGLTAIFGRLLIPVLRALKAGQSIRESGPTWHNYKAGTPMMGGLMFVAASALVLALNAFVVKDYSVYYNKATELANDIYTNAKEQWESGLWK